MTSDTPTSHRARPLALVSLTFVSDCRIPLADHGHALEALLWYATRANAIDDITGALLFTGEHFVETLEGPAAAVDDLMTRIVADQRHGDVVVIDRKMVTSRTFARWAMAYSGRSVFVARMVAAARHGDAHEVSRLLELVREFGTGLPRSHPGPA